jgi:hypothetical protein
MSRQQRWNPDLIFRRTTERQKYDDYVVSLESSHATRNITDCMPAVSVDGKLQPRAFDEKQDLWRAKDF